MPKPRSSVQEAASAITDEVLKSSAWSTQHIGELLLSRESFLKRAFSSQHRNAERFEILKLNCDMVIAHVAIAECNIEHGDYWERENSDLVNLIRRLTFQAIVQAFKSSGYETIDANLFVREKTERFSVYAGTTSVIKDIVEEVMKDHELPSRMAVAELINYLGPARISSYKEFWVQEDERTIQHSLPQKIYREWRGEVPPNWESIQFGTLLSTSLTGLDYLITRFCCDVAIALHNPIPVFP